MYRIAEASAYVGVPAATLGAWVRGIRCGSSSGGSRLRIVPVLALPINQPPMLSFANLLEAHILNALRKCRLPLQTIRRSLTYVRTELPSSNPALADHPLLGHDFRTDGKSLLIKHFGSLVNATRGGQLELEAVLEGHLRRIQHDQHGVPIRLFPFSRGGVNLDQPVLIVISPTVAFGRPVIAGTGIPVEEITGRHKAGESISDLADDYERPSQEIEEAIRFSEAA